MPGSRSLRAAGHVLSEPAATISSGLSCAARPVRGIRAERGCRNARRFPRGTSDRHAKIPLKHLHSHRCFFLSNAGEGCSRNGDRRLRRVAPNLRGVASILANHSLRRRDDPTRDLVHVPCSAVAAPRRAMAGFSMASRYGSRCPSRRRNSLGAAHAAQRRCLGRRSRRGRNANGSATRNGSPLVRGERRLSFGLASGYFEPTSRST